MSKRAPLGADELRELGAKYGSWADVARAINVPSGTIRARASALGVTIGDAKSDEQVVGESVVSEDVESWGDIRQLLRDKGLKESDWLVSRARVNTWTGADGSDHSQLRVDLEPASRIVIPARTDGWSPPKPKPRKKESGQPDLVAILSDAHIPFHSRALHAKVLSFLEAEKPDRVILLGDYLDLDQVSRWTPEPNHTATIQDTLDECYRVLAEYRAAVPDAEITFISGNHEDRLRIRLAKDLRSVFGVRRAAAFDEPSVLDVGYLLRLDELHIDYVRSEPGSYDHARVEISPELMGIHGTAARKGSAASAAATLDHFRVSVVQGHSHRAGLHFKTEWSLQNSPRTLVAAEVGTLAELKDGLGHAPAPDWQAGFATAAVWPEDGLFSLDLAIYLEREDALLWRGKRF